MIYGRKSGEEAQESPDSLGGEKISAEVASVSKSEVKIQHNIKNVVLQTLKTVCWGGENIVPRQEWIKGGLVFNEADGLNAFGLRAMKGATKSFQLVLEAYVLKHLLFEGKSTKKMAR